MHYLHYLITIERGYLIDNAPGTLLSVIGLMKGKQLSQLPKQSGVTMLTLASLTVS